MKKLLAAALLCSLFSAAAAEKPVASAAQAFPAIEMASVPLLYAVKMLSLPSGVTNLLFDPAIPAEITAKPLTLRLMGAAARQTTEEILAHNGLQLLHSPRTQTHRIVTKEKAARLKAAKPRGEVPPLQDDAVPLFTFESTPLEMAVRLIAERAKVTVEFDPQLPLGRKSVSLDATRLQNITAMQALEAILDNYDLELTPASSPRIYRVAARLLPPSTP